MQLDWQARSAHRGPLEQRNGHAAIPQAEPSRSRDISTRSQSTPALFQILQFVSVVPVIERERVQTHQRSTGRHQPAAAPAEQCSPPSRSRRPASPAVDGLLSGTV